MSGTRGLLEFSEEACETWGFREEWGWDERGM